MRLALSLVVYIGIWEFVEGASVMTGPKYNKGPPSVIKFGPKRKKSPIRKSPITQWQWPYFSMASAV